MSGLDYASVSEKDWTAQVLELLGYHGWRTAHFRTAQRTDGGFLTAVAGDGVGWPDIIAVHPKAGDILAAELKSEKGRATPAQLQWLAHLEAAGVDTYLWKPSEVDQVIERISLPVRRLRGSVGA